MSMPGVQGAVKSGAFEDWQVRSGNSTATVPRWAQWTATRTQEVHEAQNGNALEDILCGAAVGPSVSRREQWRKISFHNSLTTKI